MAARRLLGWLAASTAATAAAGAIGRALTPAPTRWLDLAGGRLALSESGRGPAVLFLHGLGGQAGNFHLLPAHLPGFRCLIPDRPGSGHSAPAAPGRAGIDGHAASAAALIEALGLGPVLVIGHSLGGAIGLRLALDRPDLVAGLVGVGALTGPHLARLSPLGRPLLDHPALRSAGTRILGAPLSALLLPAFIHASFAPEPIPPGFLHRGGLLAALAPEMAQAVIRDLEVAIDGAARLRAELPALRLPVTLVHGLQDRVLPAGAQAVAAAARIPGADLWLPDGGHMLPATQPALVAAAIRATAARAGLKA